ncbi:RHS Repeat protein [compost metagenome]
MIKLAVAYGATILSLAISAGMAAAQETQTYAYDVHGRLVSVERSAGGPTTSYVYDGASNRTQRTIGPSGTLPNTFELGGPVSAASGAWASSDTIVVSGVSAPVPVSIHGGQYRIDAGAWVAAAGTTSAGQSLQVRVQAPATGGVSQTGTLNVGGVTASFVVTSIVDTTPNAFSLGGPVTIAPFTWAESQTVTIGGINAPASVSVTNGEYRINAGAWQTTTGSISAGQMVQIRVMTQAASYTTTGTLTIGGVSSNFAAKASGIVVPPEGCTPPPGKDYCVES